MVVTKQPGFLWSLFVLSPLFIIIPFINIWRHYVLPEPVVELYNPTTNLPQLSEHAILETARYLSEEIGYRTVGTLEHALGDAWVLDKVEALKRTCEEAVSREPGRKLECEVWRQVGSGSHRFDILQKRLYKTYVNLTNIIVRISDGTDEGKEHAVLVNAHIDSTLPSPGAADDALPVGVMLETARNLIETPSWSPRHAVILLFNNAEESLQDGSHLYSKQHSTRSTVRAVLNLEACGTTGGELLFQATSEQMIDAYARVPYPNGHVVANDIFSSGIIMSDTDFRQFELYLDITGLDMAVVGNSYFYHTRKDTIENLSPGLAQHMAENTLALIKYLSAEQSPLPELQEGYKKPSIVYFSIFSKLFYRYDFATANTLHLILFIASLGLIRLSMPLGSPYRPPAVKKTRGERPPQDDVKLLLALHIQQSKWARETSWFAHLRSVAMVLVAFIGSMISVNVVAWMMTSVLNRPLSWFRVEYSCLFLYGPAALAGSLAALTIVSNFTAERTLVNSILLIYSSLAVIIQLQGFGSAVIFFYSALFLFLGVFMDRNNDGKVSLKSYAVGQIGTIFVGTEVFVTATDIFVPLTGRMGANAPAEHIIASIVAFSCFFFAPLALPFFQRFGPGFVLKAAMVMSLFTGLMMIVFSMRNPFDSMHPKRVYILHSENITTNEVSVNVGMSDSAPNFHLLAQDIAAFVSNKKSPAIAVDMHEHNADWDVIYPFSAHVSPYKVDMEPYVSSWATNGKFTVTAVDDVVDEEAKTRSLKLSIYHPGLIWTTIAFDAHVLKWSLDNNPPPNHARHYIKEASFYGEDTWSVDLVIKLDELSDPADSKLQVNFVGIKEKAMWPGKKAEKAEGGHAMQLFEELDGWLEEHTQGRVEALLLGCVGGVTTI